MYAEGFTNIIDLEFGPDGNLYVVEFNRNGLLTIDPTMPETLTGSLQRVASDGSHTTVASDGLIAPTSVAVDEDGTIYMSVFGVRAGAGQVIRLAGMPDSGGGGTSSSGAPVLPLATFLAALAVGSHHVRRRTNLAHR